MEMAQIEAGYWVVQFFAVFCGYLFLMFLWPMVVFHRHLRNKGQIYRFGFCVALQPVLVSTAVLTLGLLHILNRWTTCAVLVLPFAASLLDIAYAARKERKKRLGKRALSVRIRQSMDAFREKLQPHFWEYLGLSVLIIYALIYFSWGIFQYPSYHYGDEYVHHSWVQGLIEGKIFIDGIYPAGMHCFIYGINRLFGIPVYSVQLFLGSVHIGTVLLSIYLLLREFFEWRYSPIFSLALFLFLDGKTTWHYLIFGMSRFSWSLPQEFAMSAMFICGAFLMRYLKKRDGSKDPVPLDPDLFVFLIAMASTIVIHFYATFMAFFLCAVFTLRHIRQFKEKFWPLTGAILCGILIAVIPMLTARFSGIPFQDSISWAVQSAQGEDVTDSRGTQSLEEALWQSDDSISGKAVAVKDFYLGGIQKSYEELFGEKKGRFLIAQTLIYFLIGAVLPWLFVRLPAKIREWIDRRRLRELFYGKWLPLAGAFLLFMLLYAAPYIGLPEIIVGSRLSSSISILMAAMLTIPLDAVFVLAKDVCSEQRLQPVSFLCLAVIYTVILGTGNYHKFLYGEMMRYNADVTTVISIMDHFPEKSYTIVSPTDVLYQCIEKGWHEETLTFVKKIAEEGYTLPSEYVFILVEKKPLKYAQHIDFTGPAWLGVTREEDRRLIQASQISREAAQQELKTFERSFDSYKDLENRTVIESKAYDWCRRFALRYPQVLNTYYEDEDFVCYWFRQDPESPYNLGGL